MADETQTDEAATITYEIEFTHGARKRVTVPADWRVTYGPLTPGVKGGSYGDGEGAVLRMYESKDKQRAMFRKVTSFIDLSIKMQVEIVDTAEDTFVESDSDGNYEGRSNRAVSTTWKDQ